MIFHPTEPRVVRGADWELSTSAIHVADFAYHRDDVPDAPDIVAGWAAPTSPRSASRVEAD